MMCIFVADTLVIL